MWAAFKSDLQEFATGAAEETNVVAERVVGTRILRTTGGGNGEDDDGAGVSVLPGAAALSSIGERGLRGLTSVSSMMGGIVAPRPPPAQSVAPPPSDDAAGGVYERGGGGPAPGSALSSMLLSAVAYGDDGEGGEEEMGWSDDDDDDDDDVDAGDDDGGGGKRGATDADEAPPKTVGGPNDSFEEEELGPAPEAAVAGDVLGDSPPAPFVAGAASAAAAKAKAKAKSPVVDDSEALRALRSKLEDVERSRNELQSEHRRQTGELVELRSKVKEMERDRRLGGGGEIPSSSDEGRGGGGGDGGYGEEEARTLRLLVENLKLQLIEKTENLDKEHEELMGSILREKEILNRELIEQRLRSEELAGENRALLEQRGGGDEELLRGYQSQIRDLEDELASLRADLDSASAELAAGAGERAAVREEAGRQSARAEAPARTAEDRERAVGEEAGESRTGLAEVEERAWAAMVDPGLSAEVVDGAGTLMSREPPFSSFAAAPAPALAVADTALVASVASAGETAPEDGAAPPGAAEDPSEESPRISDDVLERTTAPQSPSPSSSGSSPVKLEAEDELSDDWGDGGWGDDV